MLRGNALAKVDEKGRLKLPSSYRAILEPRYGREFFVTSLRGDCVRIYPMEVYAAFETRLQKASQVEPLVTLLRDSVSYYGQVATMDAQGRILIHPLVRKKTSINGEVVVLGAQDFLVVWNRHDFEERLKKEPLDDDRMRRLADLGF